MGVGWDGKGALVSVLWGSTKNIPAPTATKATTVTMTIATVLIPLVLPYLYVDDMTVNNRSVI